MLIQTRCSYTVQCSAVNAAQCSSAVQCVHAAQQITKIRDYVRWRRLERAGEETTRGQSHEILRYDDLKPGAAIQCSVVQCSAEKYGAVQRSAVQCSAAHCSVALFCTSNTEQVQHSTAQCTMPAQCRVVHYSTGQCSTKKQNIQAAKGFVGRG